MTDYMFGKLSDKQTARLLQAPNPAIIKVLQGNSYLPQHEVRAELNRVFGLGHWDSEVIHMSCAFEMETKTSKGADAWAVGYLAGIRLRIRDYNGAPIAAYTEYHVGDNTQPSRAEAHATACTSAESTALRRAAMNLGDRFGLGLYADTTDTFVKGTLEQFEKADKDEIKNGTGETVKTVGGEAEAEALLEAELGAKPVTE